MTKTVLFTFFVLVATLVNAQTCKEVDLRPQLGPIQNQNGTDWCFAYPASDIVSFQLGQRVSPADIAVQYHRDWANRQLKYGLTTTEKLRQAREEEAINEMGGFVHYSIEATAPGGFCADEKINLNDLVAAKAAGDPFRFLDELNMNKFNYASAETVECYKFHMIQKLTPWNSFEEIEKIAKQNTLADVSGVMADQACGERIKPVPRIVVKTLEQAFDPVKKTSAVLSEPQTNQMNRTISSGKPVAIAVYLEKLKFFNSGDEKHQRHAMTIAGRKFNPATGKCEYILRNSWGPECESGWKPGVRCDRNSGYLFVDPDILEQAIYKAHYIE